MLDLVPLAGARWQMMDLDVDADLGGKSVEFALPKTNAGAVAATTICRDHEVLGVRIADPSDLIPPATDGRRSHRRLGALGFLLGAYAPRLLRLLCLHQVAACCRGAGTHPNAIRHRGRDPGASGRTSTTRATTAKSTDRGGSACLAGRLSTARVRCIRSCYSDALRVATLVRPGRVPGGWTRRDRLECRRARDQADTDDKKGRTLRWFRRRSPSLGDCHDTHPNCQAQRRRTNGLADRCARTHRRRPHQDP